MQSMKFSIRKFKSFQYIQIQNKHICQRMKYLYQLTLMACIIFATSTLGPPLDRLIVDTHQLIPRC